jgi:hypothetical protein
VGLQAGVRLLLDFDWPLAQNQQLQGAFALETVVCAQQTNSAWECGDKQERLRRHDCGVEVPSLVNPGSVLSVAATRCAS